MKGKIKLKPCPFCGEIPILRTGEKYPLTMVQCCFCGAITSFSGVSENNKAIDDVIMLYNMRASETGKQ
ncbi:MAG: Lar family restriction alleviation protein [Deferribacteraceae bacterium]|jgi:hypothetical protein|nr:Lar family restriction alleviation protein [Deferribacteraceae bacterium]